MSGDLSEKVHVPDTAAIMAMSMEELKDFQIRLAGASGDLEAKLATVVNPYTHKALTYAARQVNRGQRTVNAVLAQRYGTQTFKRAREVVDVETAVAAHKAISRLLDLLHEVYRAVDDAVAAEVELPVAVMHAWSVANNALAVTR